MPAIYSIIDLTPSAFGSAYNTLLAPAINDDGQVAGTMNNRPFVFDGVTTTVLSISQGDARAINADGVVVGRGLHDGFFEAYLYDGTIHWLGSFGGGHSAALDINADGDVVGWAYTSDNRQHAFLYRDGVMTDINPFSSEGSEADAINDDGTIAGTYRRASRLIRRVRLRRRDRGRRSARSSTARAAGCAMNEAGEVVGDGTGRPIDGSVPLRRWPVPDDVPLGALGSHGVAINEAGVITGWSQSFTNAPSPVFLFDGTTVTTIPEVARPVLPAGRHQRPRPRRRVRRPARYLGERGFLWNGVERLDLTGELPLASGYVIKRGLLVQDDGTIVALARAGGGARPSCS